MNTQLVFALIAIICFVLALVDPRAGWIGLVFLTVSLCLA